MGRRAAHELHEVPVLPGGGGVLQDIAGHLGVDAGGGVEAEGDGEQVANLQVAVDGLRHPDHLHAAAVLLHALEEELGQDGGVGIGVVAPDDHDGIELVVDAGLLHRRELIVLLDLGAVGAEEVEAAGVQDLGHRRIGDLEELALDEPLGARANAEEPVLAGEHRLEPGDDVVAAGGGAAREQHGHPLALARRGVLAASVEDLPAAEAAEVRGNSALTGRRVPG